MDPHSAVGALFEAGVRSALLLGPSRLADRYAAAKLVDRVLAYLPHEEQGSDLVDAAVPAGLVIKGISTTGQYVRVELASPIQ